MGNKKLKGFTLIEILLVLALVAVLAGIVAGNVGVFIESSNLEPPNRVLKKAVLDAVYLANERKRETRLSYLEENASFLVTTTSGTILEQHKVYQEITEKIRNNTESIPKVFFKAIGPLSGVDGDFTKIDDDLLALKSVRFHSGVSTPFSVEISFRGKLEEFTFDPFSGYMIDPEKIE